MVKLLVDSGAQIDNKNEVSTKLCMVLHCDSSVTIYLHLPPPPPHSLTLFLPPTLVPLSPVDVGLVKGVEVVGICSWSL